MAATNYTPIQIYYSTTASSAPTAANLALGELAINVTDGKLYYEDNSGVVQVIATKGAGTIGGSTTQIQYNNAGALAGNAAMTFNSGTSTTTLATLNLTNALGAIYGGTAQSTYTQGDVLYASASNTLSKLGIGAANYILTSTGSVPQWVAPSSIAVLTATNLAGGVAGSVPYQSGVATTTFLGIGAANRIMTSTGTAPQWVTALTGLTGVSSSSITNTTLTSGRVVVSTTGGLQSDDSDLTFDGTTLSAGGLSTVGLSTLVKTVKVGDSGFSGAAVFAAATPAKLYVGTGTVTDVTSAISATNTTGAVTALAITPIAASNTGVTYTNASTLYIDGAPSAGTNITITNPYALYVAAGQTYLGAALVGPASATVFNTVSTTVNAFGAATTLNIGSASTTAGTVYLPTVNAGITTVDIGAGVPAFKLSNATVGGSVKAIFQYTTATGTAAIRALGQPGSGVSILDITGQIYLSTEQTLLSINNLGLVSVTNALTVGTTLGVTGQTNVSTSSGYLYVNQTSQITGAMIETQQRAGLFGLGINGAAGEDAVVYLRATGGGSGGIIASNGDLVFKPGNTAAMTLAAAGAVTIPGTLASGALTVTSAYADPTSGVGVVISASSTSFAIDKGGSIVFNGAYTGTMQTNFGGIKGAKLNATDGNTAGYLGFFTRADSALPAEYMRLTSTGLTVTGTLGVTNSISAQGGSAPSAGTTQAFLFSNGGLPTLSLVRSANTADARNHLFAFNANGVLGRLSGQFLNDAYSVANTWLTVDGASTGTPSITFTGNTTNTGTLVVTGLPTFTAGLKVGEAAANVGRFFGKAPSVTGGAGATSIKASTGPEGSLYVVSGVNGGLAKRFTDLVMMLGASSATPTTISAIDLNTPPTRTYSRSGENLFLSLSGTDVYTVNVTGMGGDESA